MKTPVKSWLVFLSLLLILSPLILLLPRITPIGTATAIFGLSSGDSTAAGTSQMNIQRFLNTAGKGLLNNLEVLVDNPQSSKIRLGVYADYSGYPGSLLLDAGEIAALSGWNSISGLSLAVTADTYYWLAFLPQAPLDVRYQSRGQPDYCHAYHPQEYGPLPLNFGSGEINNSPYIMRATVSKKTSTVSITPKLR